jgi:multiple sugar transport system permease protein
MRHITKTERRGRSVFLHVALAAGSFVFSIPFIWLFSTSCKVPDEMYPPKWLPQVPKGVVESPYIQIRQNERSTRPPGVSRQNWERVKQPVLEAIAAHTAGMANQMPDFYRPYLGHMDIADGLLNRLVKRAPDELFKQPEAEVAQWFASRVTDEMVRYVFETVYRRVAVSDVTFRAWDVLTVEYPTASKEYPWELTEGDAELIDRREGLLRPAKEVHYNFDEQDAYSLGITLPLEMAPEELKRIVVSVHCDRSWHEIWPTIEFNGKRYRAAQAAYLGSDRWQDIAWQFESAEDESIQMKTWIRLVEDGTSAFAEPGKIRISLDFQHASRPGATFNKYANNYREVLRRVPLFAYVKNSVFLVVLNILGQVIGSSLVAFAFARLRWPARDFCFMLVLATLMIPPQVTMIPVFLIYKNLGWYNTLQPLWVGSFFGSAFYIFLLRQFMRGIPLDLEDSAKIDGCGYLGIYARIILPLIKPALAAIGIFTFMGTWNDFMGPLIYLSDQELYPLSLGLFALQVFQGGNFGLMMAASVLMTIPVILLFFVAQRHFIQGITLTGLKG